MSFNPPFDRPRPLRQSMAWLHTWTGLLLGWLLFVIFASGSLSFFRNEINFWMHPELHHLRDDARAIIHARRVLEREAPDSRQWTITLPGPRDPTLFVAWRADVLSSRYSSPSPRSGASRRPAHGSRPEMKRLGLDPSTGEILKMRESSGATFLFRLHFQLHGVSWFVGRWTVGIAAMVMLVALVTGVIIHRNFFKDFFTFRPNRGKRSWLDAHALVGVVSLPFHFAITFSGLLLLGAMLMPSVVRSVYPDDATGFTMGIRGGRDRFNIAPPSRKPAPLGDLAPMVDAAQEEWRGGRAGSVVVANPGDAGATVEVIQAQGYSLANRGIARRLLFDGITGKRLETPPAKASSAIVSVWNSLVTLHLGRFATPVQRWLLFLAGISGALMIATGLILWRISRFKARGPGEAIPVGCRCVEILNVSGISGWLIALGAYFWAGRLLPDTLFARSEWEIRVFFLAWAASLIHATLRKHLSAWVEQLSFSGALIALLPLVNGLTGVSPLFRSLASGPWQVAGFDLCALFAGALLLFAARKVHLHNFGSIALHEPGERPLPATDERSRRR
ncbi:MAG: PepSY domain-containing protein [Candidatus Accumulibacter sp.]|jgi:uncharacterized iron-regulated membrane protein|nr:PepSY domain-containing protein [Accumulibacter sp.]